MPSVTPPVLTLYGAPDCCLCDQAKALIEKVRRDVPVQLVLLDIQSDPRLFERYRYAIPVVAIDARVVMAGKVTEFWLRKALRGERLERASLSALEPLAHC